MTTEVATPETPIAVPKKPYTSPSQLDTICRCPEQWRRIYMEGERLPPGVAAMQGTAVHDGAAINFRQKIKTHEDLPRNDIVEAAVAKFEAEAAGTYVMTPEESSRGAGTVIGEAKDQVADMATLLADEIVPEYQPVLVEQPVRIILPEASHDLLGILDLADDKRRVVDFKTSGKRKTQGEADQSVQLTFYAAGHRVLTGELPTELRLEVMVKKGVPERQIVRTQRGPDDFAALAHRVNSVLQIIDNGVFMPAPPGSWYCSAKWCGFWPTCRYVNANPQRVYSIAPPKPQPLIEELRAAISKETLQRAVPKKPGKNLKERLWNETKRVCKFCDAPLTLVAAIITPIVPLAHGGSNKPENLTVACRVCSDRQAAAGTPETAESTAGGNQ